MSLLTFEETLLTLEGTGPVLAVAREVSEILRQSQINGAIIGGIAVSLHGYVRTTVDVDVFVEGDADRLSEQLIANGFAFEPETRQFVKNRVPVRIVTRNQLQSPPKHFEDIEGLRTVSLADLINMKLRSGTRSVLCTKDLGDVIGLIRRHRLTGEFTPKIEESLRPEFRKLLDAIERERGEA